MHRRIFPVLLAAIMVVVISCGTSGPPKIVDSGGDPDDTVITIEFADYVHFDTSSYILMSYNYGESWGILGELYVWWEEVFGEPYIDFNGNHVYDEGIDFFFITSDSTNMDLNHNGRWDGPDDPWLPGMPFDDLDGNGVPRQGEVPYMRLYAEGAPFCDFNGNGVWDSLPQFAYDMVRCSVSTGTDSSEVYNYWYKHSAYYFISDSGRWYALPSYDFYQDSYFQETQASHISFELTDSGLVYTPQHQLHFHVLDTGATPVNTPISDSGYPVGSNMGPITFTKEVTVGEHLELDGTIYDDVIIVRFFDPSSNYYWYDETLWEFYFTRELGFLGIAFKPFYQDDVQRYFFHRRFDPDTIPLPMTR